MSEAQLVARLLAWEASCPSRSIFPDGGGDPALHPSGLPLLVDFAYADPS